MKLLIDHLAKVALIEESEGPAAANTYMRGLYLTSIHFAKYADLCYNWNYHSAWKGPFPKFNLDDAPIGFSIGTLEGVFSRVNTTLYEKVRSLPMERVEAILIQILESLHPIEVNFLRGVIDKKMEHFTEDDWKEMRNVNWKGA